MSAVLSGGVDRIDAVTATIDPEAVGRIVANTDKFSGEFSALTTEITDILAAVPPERVETVLADISTFTDSLARNFDQIDSLFAATYTLSEGITTMVANLDPAVLKINEVAAQIDPAMIGRMLGNVDDFATRLGNNSASVDTIVANLNEVSSSLVGLAGKVTEILDKLDRSVTNAEGQDAFEQIGDAAMSIRRLADQLNTSTASIAVGLNNFTSSGLPGYASLAQEARATLQRLDRVVRNLEKIRRA
ncbi:MAG: hypothetical protein MO852_03050 [Candidatus Devosia euplotis]|nr:hypothetical protein [Candidatus Devosia euplotis]